MREIVKEVSGYVFFLVFPIRTQSEKVGGSIFHVLAFDNQNLFNPIFASVATNVVIVYSSGMKVRIPVWTFPPRR